eukprot:NODE_140_length_1323_cov_274.081633_g109_i0.p1 GENE.NODE_140_length_1323_cov_274.081633_g109_i0~~NODE_140_length_1323_cov_274.081633_g109_i0.p1  ORF type:complete len:389 (+),score=77.10 NODE_140_length_1323_cov_274.081633_g109_i0:55-1221(+)
MWRVWCMQFLQTGAPSILWTLPPEMPPDEVKDDKKEDKTGDALQALMESDKNYKDRRHTTSRSLPFYMMQRRAPSRVEARISRKDLRGPNAPKPNVTAYLHFTAEFRDEAKAQIGTAAIGAMAKQLGTMWKALSTVEKVKYAELAVKDKERYLREQEEYERTEEYKQRLHSMQQPPKHRTTGKPAAGGRSPQKAKKPPPKQERPPWHHMTSWRTDGEGNWVHDSSDDEDSEPLMEDIPPSAEPFIAGRIRSTRQLSPQPQSATFDADVEDGAVLEPKPITFAAKKKRTPTKPQRSKPPSIAPRPVVEEPPQPSVATALKAKVHRQKRPADDIPEDRPKQRKVEVSEAPAPAPTVWTRPPSAPPCPTPMLSLASLDDVADLFFGKSKKT